MAAVTPADPIIEVRNVFTRFGAAVVHEDVSLEVRRGEIFALAGASGCGKSTLLREIIALLRPVSGSIRVFGREVVGLNDAEAMPLRRQWGVIFERGALFSSLTVSENVGRPLREHTRLGDRLGNSSALPCKDCHAVTPASFKQSATSGFMPCRGCHTKPDPNNPKLVSLKVAYHSQCFDCHRGMGNIGTDPKGCTELCHAAKGTIISKAK